jgi:hypothetical protein
MKGIQVRPGFDPLRFRPLFYAAAGWNLVAAGVALAAPAFHAEAFFGSGAALASPEAALNSRIMWVSIGLLGFGYWLVARNPRKNHGLVLVAAMGKTCVAALWIAAFAQNTVGSLALAGAVGDLAFAGLFFRFLVAAQRAPDPGGVQSLG